MSTTATTGIVTPKTVEDWLLFLTPIIGGAAGLSWGGIVPGASGFLVGVIFASLAKSLVGLGQNPHPSNWEDWLSFAITFLGFLGTAFSANPSYATYAVIIGLLVKALGIVKTGGLNIEDLALAAGAVIAGIGQYTGNPTLLNAGLMFGLVGKALPSIGTNGNPAVLKTPIPPATP
jgi:hypothetical protein